MSLGQLPLYMLGGSAPPTISAVNFAAFDSLGGDPLTITGTNLTGATISVGGTSATVTASSGTSLTFTTPAKTAGSGPTSYNIVATNGGGSSSGFSVTSIDMKNSGTTLNLFLRTSLGLAQTSNTVTSWTDQGSSSFSFATSAGSLPHYTSSDSDFNGQPSIGNTSTTTSESKCINHSGTWSMTSPSTCYWVIRMYGAGSQFWSCPTSNSTTTNAHWLLIQPGGWFYGDDSLSLSGSSFFTNNTTYVICANYASSGSGLYANASATNLGSGSLGTIADGGNLMLGTSGGGIWRMTEHLRFNGSHSSTLRQQIMLALGAKYGVATS